MGIGRGETWEHVVHGMVGGLNGAACMTALRLVVRRFGLIDKMPPEMLEEWTAARLAGRSPRDHPVHDVAHQLLHLGIGVTAGALYAAAGSRRLPNLLAGPCYGLVIWALAFSVPLPAIGATRSPRRATIAENTVNVAAHLLYGLIAGLTMDELSRRPPRGVPEIQREIHRVG